MVTGICLRNPGIPAGCLPVKIAAVHDDAADGSAVASDKLCGGMYHDIGAVLNGTDQIRCRKGGIHHQRNMMPVGNFRQVLQVCQVGVGISQGLHENRLGVVLNRRLERALLLRVHKSSGNAAGKGKGMGQQVVGAAVNRPG